MEQINNSTVPAPSYQHLTARAASIAQRTSEQCAKVLTTLPSGKFLLSNADMRHHLALRTSTTIPEFEFRQDRQSTCLATNGHSVCGVRADHNGHHRCKYEGHTIVLHDTMANAFCDMLVASGHTATTRCQSLRRLHAAGESRLVHETPQQRHGNIRSDHTQSATDVTAMENAKAVDKELTPDVDLIDAYGTHFDVVCPDIFASHRVLNKISPEATIAKAASAKRSHYAKASAPVLPLVFTEYAFNDAAHVWIGKAAERARSVRNYDAKAFKAHWTRHIMFTHVRATAHIARLVSHTYRYGSRRTTAPLPSAAVDYERVIQMDHARRFACNAY